MLSCRNSSCASLCAGLRSFPVLAGLSPNKSAIEGASKALPPRYSPTCGSQKQRVCESGNDVSRTLELYPSAQQKLAELVLFLCIGANHALEMRLQ